MGEVSVWQVFDGAVLTLDNPPVNAISADVRSALVEGVARANADAGLASLVIACAGRTFFAGIAEVCRCLEAIGISPSNALRNL